MMCCKFIYKTVVFLPCNNKFTQSCCFGHKHWALFVCTAILRTFQSEEIMSYRQIHLHKSGSGFASNTACGRNILRTPISANWEEFKKEPEQNQCIKCRNSKQYEVNAKMDARKNALLGI